MRSGDGSGELQWFYLAWVSHVCVLVCPKAGDGLSLGVPWLERHG
jgi:hypothetical protein